MKFIDEIKSFSQKRVLVRCDFNCPLDEKGEIVDDTRIKKIIPTIEDLIKKEAKVILISHLGRPEGKKIEKLKMDKIQEKLMEYLDLSIIKAPDCIGKNIEKETYEMLPGEILLLENVRFHKEEEECKMSFAKKLSRLGDIFVQDAFSVCHRKHASVYLLPQLLPSFGGLLLKKEIKILENLLKNPKRPLVSIFGGVKIETKIEAIKELVAISDYVLLGGRIPVRMPFVSANIFFPLDWKTKDGKPLDIGEKTISKYKEIIKKAKMILWNGPLGMFEKKEFERGTKEIAKTIAETKAFKIAGGGETLLAIKKYQLEDKFDFLSTGGGAMLSFLAGERLPGLEALNYYEKN